MKTIYFLPLVFLLGVIFSYLITSPFISSIMIFNAESSLEGLEYYQEDTFAKTYYNIRKDYKACYDASYDFSSHSLKDLKNCTVEGFDCEDFTAILYHLSKQYNETCRLEYITNWFGVMTHSGIECKVKGDWVSFN